ncbi:hypothetical protein OE88DRAFT_533969 [Heliocybe sulcata]|uniref:Uncharacterized protein n=1 Tax=Heliocybe sulcata TaxID=5364 RepID=A0A5C3MTW4_9AGAM|nr:hypothetical protein OE88DRAFT_533969 [Heliocybe sulcata]
MAGTARARVGTSFTYPPESVSQLSRRSDEPSPSTSEITPRRRTDIYGTPLYPERSDEPGARKQEDRAETAGPVKQERGQQRPFQGFLDPNNVPETRERLLARRAVETEELASDRHDAEPPAPVDVKALPQLDRASPRAEQQKPSAFPEEVEGPPFEADVEMEDGFSVVGTQGSSGDESDDDNDERVPIVKQESDDDRTVWHANNLTKARIPNAERRFTKAERAQLLKAWKVAAPMGMLPVIGETKVKKEEMSDKPSMLPDALRPSNFDAWRFRAGAEGLVKGGEILDAEILKAQKAVDMTNEIIRKGKPVLEVLDITRYVLEKNYFAKMQDKDAALFRRRKKRRLLDDYEREWGSHDGEDRENYSQVESDGDEQGHHRDESRGYSDGDKASYDEEQESQSERESCDEEEEEEQEQEQEQYDEEQEDYDEEHEDYDGVRANSGFANYGSDSDWSQRTYRWVSAHPTELFQSDDEDDATEAEGLALERSGAPDAEDEETEDEDAEVKVEEPDIVELTPRGSYETGYRLDTMQRARVRESHEAYDFRPSESSKGKGRADGDVEANATELEENARARSRGRRTSRRSHEALDPVAGPSGSRSHWPTPVAGYEDDYEDYEPPTSHAKDKSGRHYYEALDPIAGSSGTRNHGPTPVPGYEDDYEDYEPTTSRVKGKTSRSYYEALDPVAGPSGTHNHGSIPVPGWEDDYENYEGPMSHGKGKTSQHYYETSHPTTGPSGTRSHGDGDAGENSEMTDEDVEDTGTEMGADGSGANWSNRAGYERYAAHDPVAGPSASRDQEDDGPVPQPSYRDDYGGYEAPTGHMKGKSSRRYYEAVDPVAGPSGTRRHDDEVPDEDSEMTDGDAEEHGVKLEEEETELTWDHGAGYGYRVAPNSPAGPSGSPFQEPEDPTTAPDASYLWDDDEEEDEEEEPLPTAKGKPLGRTYTEEELAMLFGNNIDAARALNFRI